MSYSCGYGESKNCGSSASSQLVNGRSASDDADDVATFEALIHPIGADSFFSEVWQRKPAFFAHSTNSPSYPSKLPKQSWTDCCDMLSLAWGAAMTSPPRGCEIIMFQDKEITDAYLGTGPASALLDGCSCVVNHAEYVWAPFHTLCSKLRRKLGHVYTNTYVTPAGCQAVRPHADDRDVFILQVCGSKLWRVWGSPPVYMPYSHEQVGKQRPVPDEVLESPPSLEVTLNPGDVLYMPRGFVHEARSPGDVSSWHATLAVATHDWSWTKVVLATMSEKLDEDGSKWRQAVPLGLSVADGKDDEEDAEKMLHELIDIAKRAVDVSKLRARFSSKLEHHNVAQDNAFLIFQEGLDLQPWNRLENQTIYTWDQAHWRTGKVKWKSRVRKALESELEEEEKHEAETLMRLAEAKGMGKGKGKGKPAPRGYGPFCINLRKGLVQIISAIFKEVEQRGEAGIAVAELGGIASAADPEGSKIFDELAQICLAKFCVGSGHYREIREPTQVLA